MVAVVAEEVEISIHAPAKGATKHNLSLLTSFEFQSTLPRKERLGEKGGVQQYFIISIHAPAKGATPFDCSLAEELRYFNPRSRERSDIIR